MISLIGLDWLMRLNADFSKRIVIDTEAMPWEASPMPGVKRRKLDRIGEEVARATSLVKYDPDSYFSAHTHGGGEEFFVLEGVFSDEHGDYPAGTYVRNPIGSSHTPRSEEGCIIFVKLHQFDEEDQAQFHIDTVNAEFLPGSAPGLTVLPLHSHKGECWTAYFPMKMVTIPKGHGYAVRICRCIVLSQKRAA